MNIPKWLRSSTGEGVALRWKACAAGLIPLGVLAARYFGYDVTEAAGNELVEVIADAIVVVWAAVAALAGIAGWARRNFNKEHRIGAYDPTLDADFN